MASACSAIRIFDVAMAFATRHPLDEPPPAGVVTDAEPARQRNERAERNRHVCLVESRERLGALPLAERALGS